MARGPPRSPLSRSAAASDVNRRQVSANAVETPSRSSAFDAVLSALSTTGAGPLEFLYKLEGVDVEARVTTAREGIRLSLIHISEPTRPY